VNVNVSLSVAFAHCFPESHALIHVYLIVIKSKLFFVTHSHALFRFIAAILQRTTVNVGQIKIQGVATCLFLCMDSCGTTYGSVSASVSITTTTTT